MSKRGLLVLGAFLAAGLAGCSSSSTTPTPTQFPIDRMYISDSNASLVDWYTLPVSISSTTAGSLGAANAISGTIGLAFDGMGNMYAANFNNHTVTIYARTITATSQPVATLTVPGHPCGVAIDPTTGNLWMTDNSGFHVYEFIGPFSGASTPTPAATISAGLTNTPCYMTFDAAGDLFVANVNGTTVVAYTHPLTNGMAASFTLSGMAFPSGMAFDAAGNLYVSSCAAAAPSPIYKFNAPVNANATPSATDPGANTTVNCADGATLDPSGNFWVGDFNGRFLEFAVGSGTFTSMAPSLTLTPGGGFANGYDVKFGP